MNVPHAHSQPVHERNRTDMHYPTPQACHECLAITPPFAAQSSPPENRQHLRQRSGNISGNAPHMSPIAQVLENCGIAATDLQHGNIPATFRQYWQRFRQQRSPHGPFPSLEGGRGLGLLPPRARSRALTITARLARAEKRGNPYQHLLPAASHISRNVR